MPEWCVPEKPDYGKKVESLEMGVASAHLHVEHCVRVHEYIFMSTSPALARVGGRRGGVEEGL